MVSKFKYIPIVMLIGTGLLLAGCATVLNSASYKAYVKPLVTDIHAISHSLELHRDATCVTEECKWQSGAFDHE